MSFFIAYIFANDDHRQSKSVDKYASIFKYGLELKLWDDKFFWDLLIKFCGFDRIIAEESIAKLLPEKKK